MRYLLHIRFSFITFCSVIKENSHDNDNFAEKINSQVMNFLFYAGPVLSTYQSFRLPYFTPLLPTNAIILASNLIPARMAELGGADSAHLHSSRAGIDVSAPSLPHPTTGN